MTHTRCPTGRVPADRNVVSYQAGTHFPYPEAPTWHNTRRELKSNISKSAAICNKCAVNQTRGKPRFTKLYLEIGLEAWI